MGQGAVGQCGGQPDSQIGKFGSKHKTRGRRAGGRLLRALGRLAERACCCWTVGLSKTEALIEAGSGDTETVAASHPTSAVVGSEVLPLDCKLDRWGVWKLTEEVGGTVLASVEDVKAQHMVRICVDGQEVRGCFQTREAAMCFQAEQLSAQIQWPRQPLAATPSRSPIWDHPEDLEDLKEYSFREARFRGDRSVLTESQLQRFSSDGFLLGIPVLDAEELVVVCRDFDDLLGSRIDRAPSDEARFRSAHTLSRPLHQDLVAQLATHHRVVSIVEDIIGPQFVCWSAHLFCKLPGDPTAQPWHQDAGFWPLSKSRALTLWIAFDDVDASNSSVTFVRGSHRLGRLPWRATSEESVLLTQEIPDVDLLGEGVPALLRAGEASVHCDLTVHGSRGNSSNRRRAGLALRYVASEAVCLGPMINGYRMNAGCLLPKGQSSDPGGHWRALKRRGGSRSSRRHGAKADVGSVSTCTESVSCSQISPT